MSTYSPEWTSTGMTAVYRFWAADGSLIYVGFTASLRQRFLDHQADKPWWPEVARKTVRWYPTRGDAATAEDAVLAARRPRYNKQKRSGGPVGVPGATDYVGIYAAEKGITRDEAARLVRRDRGALRDALAARQRKQEAIARHFAAIRREAPDDEGEPYGPATATGPGAAGLAIVGLRVGGAS